MKKQLLVLKISLIAILLTATNLAKSAVYYTCVGTTLSFTPSLPPGSTALWDVKDAGNASISGYPSATTPTVFSQTGTYTVYLMAKNTASGQCESDPVENKIFVLPSFSITLTTDIAEYCENNTENVTVTAEVSRTGVDGSYSLPGGVTYELKWYTTPGATGVALGSSTVLSTTGTTADEGTYLVNGITTAGDYYYNTQAAYDITGATESGTWLGTGCINFAAASAHIKVNPKPAQPSVIIAAN